MSSLLSLNIIGDNAYNIESFSSYLVRLSLAHGVSVNKLLGYVYVKYHIDNNIEIKRIPNFSTIGNASTIIRPNKSALEVVKYIENATDIENVDRTAFTWLSEVMNRGDSAFSKYVKWCPVCFKEDEQVGLDPYYRLYWQLGGVNHCVTHHVRLLDDCPKCGSVQGSYGKIRRLTECCSCDSSLYKGAVIKKNQSWQYEAVDMIDLINDRLNDGKFFGTKEGFKKSLQSLLKYYRKLDKLDELFLIMPGSEILGVIKGYRKPSLLTARRISYHFSLSLKAVLMGDINECDLPLDISWNRELPIDIKDTSILNRYDHGKVFDHMQKLIDEFDESMSVSMEEFARILGVTKGYLEHKYPTQMAKLKKKRKEWVMNESREKDNKCLKAAKCYFYNNDIPEYHKSISKALTEIYKDTRFPRYRLEKSIQIVFSEYNLQ